MTFVHCGLLGVEVGLAPVHIVLDGDAAPLPKKGAEPSPNFRPIFIVAKRWMHQHATWYGGRPQPRRHCVQCGPSYPQKKGTPTFTQFLAHVYCGQIAGWMNTPLGTEVDLGPGHIVYRRGPSSHKGGTAAPSFRPMSSVATVAHLSYC